MKALGRTALLEETAECFGLQSKEELCMRVLLCTQGRDLTNTYLIIFG
jgi:hypothetical protein